MNRDDVEQILRTETNQNDLQKKLHKLYILGIALGKILDTSNVNNLVSSIIEGLISLNSIDICYPAHLQGV